MPNRITFARPVPSERSRRVVGAGTSIVSAGSAATTPASARPPAPARRSGRAGRGTGCRARSARGRSAARHRCSADSSTSNRPSCASADRRPGAREATPDSRLAPAPLRHRLALAARARRRPSRRWSSCRWWPRPACCRPAAVPRAARSHRGRAAAAALPGRLVPPPRSAQPGGRCGQPCRGHLRREQHAATRRSGREAALVDRGQPLLQTRPGLRLDFPVVLGRSG